MRKLFKVVLAVAFAAVMVAGTALAVDTDLGLTGNATIPKSVIDAAVPGAQLLVVVEYNPGPETGQAEAGYGIGGLCTDGGWVVNDAFEARTIDEPVRGQKLTLTFDLDAVKAAATGDINLNFYNGFVVTKVVIRDSSSSLYPDSSVAYLDPTDAANPMKSCTDYTLYNGENTLASGWWVVSGAVTNTGRIVVSGDVNLILEDGAELAVSNGIRVAVENGVTNSLTVWAQSDDRATAGKLTVSGPDGCVAGIGGNDWESGGTVTVNGGVLDITGGYKSAAIGGGRSGAGGTTTINGGFVAVAGAQYGTGIGGGMAYSANYGSGNVGSVAINGGEVVAIGSDYGAGIGGGGGTDTANGSSGGTVRITGGTVAAIGGSWGAGIGGGYASAGCAVTISGGIVTATSSWAQAIGCGYDATASGSLSIPGMKVYADEASMNATPDQPVAAGARETTCRGTWAGLKVCTHPHLVEGGNCENCGMSWLDALRTLCGDANCDGQVDFSDSIAILQALANKDKYELSKTGRANADVDGNAAVTGTDALRIQMFVAGVLPDLGGQSVIGTPAADLGTVRLLIRDGYNQKNWATGHPGETLAVDVYVERAAMKLGGIFLRLGGVLPRDVRVSVEDTWVYALDGNKEYFQVGDYFACDALKFGDPQELDFHESIICLQLKLPADLKPGEYLISPIDFCQLFEEGTSHIYNVTYSPLRLMVHDDSGIPYFDPTDAAHPAKACANYTLYNGENTLASGWWVVSGTNGSTSRIAVSGDVNILLMDGAELTAAQGFHVTGTNRLTVWAQSGERTTAGKLVVSGPDDYVAGIGGDDGETGGIVTVNGGGLDITGGYRGAAIGGGRSGGGCDATIVGGTVTAVGGLYAQAIGCGSGGAGSGNLVIDGMRVYPGKAATEPVAAVDRQSTCHSQEARLEVCSHGGDSGVCPWCGVVAAWAQAYVEWAATNGIAGAWNAKDADGIVNVFRYLFNQPTNAFDETPMLSIEVGTNGQLRAITPPVANTTGFDCVLSAADDPGWTDPTAHSLSPTGETDLPGEPPEESRTRFFRLKAVPSE